MSSDCADKGTLLSYSKKKEHFFLSFFSFPFLCGCDIYKYNICMVGYSQYVNTLALNQMWTQNIVTILCTHIKVLKLASTFTL